MRPRVQRGGNMRGGRTKAVTTSGSNEEDVVDALRSLDGTAVALASFVSIALTARIELNPACEKTAAEVARIMKRDAPVGSRMEGVRIGNIAADAFPKKGAPPIVSARVELVASRAATSEGRRPSCGDGGRQTEVDQVDCSGNVREWICSG